MLHALAISLLSSAVFSTQAQPADPPAPPAQSQPTRSLDDLLGVTEESSSPATAPDAAKTANEQELEKKLNEQQVAEAFVQAVDKMRLSADLLETSRDTGLGTQRTQEEILAKLQILLDQARKNKNQSMGSSSQSQQNQQRNQNSQDPGKKSSQQQRTNQDRTNQSPSDSTQEMESPPPLQPDIDTALQETRAQWGTLPQRVREMLMQGSRDKFSSLYDVLTREYYRRLAEDAAR